MKITFNINEFDALLFTYLDNMYSCLYDIRNYFRGLLKYDKPYNKQDLDDMLYECNFDYIYNINNYDETNNIKIKFDENSDAMLIRFVSRYGIFNVLSSINKTINEYEENNTKIDYEEIEKFNDDIINNMNINGINFELQYI